MHLFNYIRWVNPFSYYGALSDRQLLKYLGDKIFIFPFNEKNLKGSTFNLTASQFAYYVDDKKNQVSVLTEDNRIKFPPYRIVNILTQECIFVEKNFCGTYHTKVSCIKKGLSSISTTLDPMYHGASLISITNLTEKELDIEVGDTFASLMLYKMHRSTGNLHDNPPSRLDISKSTIDRYDYIKDNEKKIDANKKLKELINAPYYSNLRILKKEVKKIKKDLDKDMYSKYNWLLLALIQLIIVLAVGFYTKDQITNKNIQVIVPFSIMIVNGIILTIKEYINR